MICYVLFSAAKMRGTRRSARLTGAPPENEGMEGRPPALPRAMSQRAGRERSSRDPRRSFDESRRETEQRRRSSDTREEMDVDPRRDGGLGVGTTEEDVGSSQGGGQASGYGYPPHYQPYPQGPGYSMGGTSDYPSFHPYPTYMPYPPYYPPYPPYPMYPPSPFYPSPAYSTPESSAPPPPPPVVQPEAPVIQTPQPGPSVRSKVKMTDYLKLDAPKYQSGDDPFEYIKAVKMIADELGADDTRAIQMAGFTLKCKKAKEWFGVYVDPRLDNMSWEEFANEFAGWAFPDSSKELKMIEFEQLKQTEDMSIDEFTDRFLELLRYAGQAYDTEQKKARRYAMKLHSRYSSLIHAAERESFHTVVDLARRMEASAIIQGTVKQQPAQSSGSKTPGRGKSDPSSQGAATSSGKKWSGSTQKSRKNKFWNKIKAGLGLGSGMSSGSEVPVCGRCGKAHRGVVVWGLQDVTGAARRDTWLVSARRHLSRLHPIRQLQLACHSHQFQL